MGEGVLVCLGTDSLASVQAEADGIPKLSMQAELREWVSRRPEVRPEVAIEMATVAGARALGLGGRAGELRSDMWADLMATPNSGSLEDVAETLIFHPDPVAATWLAGRPVWSGQLRDQP